VVNFDAVQVGNWFAHEAFNSAEAFTSAKAFNSAKALFPLGSI
jgi:hypothetical protein